jgi:transposase
MLPPREYFIRQQPHNQWRRESRRSQLTATERPTLVPVEVSDDPATTIPVVGCHGDHQRVEIVLCNGRILRMSTGLSDAMLMRLIRLAEAA